MEMQQMTEGLMAKMDANQAEMKRQQGKKGDRSKRSERRNDGKAGSHDTEHPRQNGHQPKGNKGWPRCLDRRNEGLVKRERRPAKNRRRLSED
jgi:hypothetical protein